MSKQDKTKRPATLCVTGIVVFGPGNRDAVRRGSMRKRIRLNYMNYNLLINQLSVVIEVELFVKRPLVFESARMVDKDRWMYTLVRVDVRKPLEVA